MKKLKVLFLFGFLTSMLFGCSDMNERSFDQEEIAPVSSIHLTEAEAGILKDKIPIQLYFGDEAQNKLVLEVRYIPVEQLKGTANDIAKVIVDELIKGPAQSGLCETIPKETKLLGKVDVFSGVATVNFSKEFVEKHPGGKAKEQLTIYSIVNSLTELKEINKVKFKVEGKVKKEFKGNFQFDNAFPRSTTLISKKQSQSVNESELSKETNTLIEDKETLSQDGEAAVESSEILEDEPYDAVFQEEAEESYIEVVD
jgi:germination protein M